MTRTLTCTVCPKGCCLCANFTPNGITVSGYGCKRGISYAITECTAPKRTVTAVVRVRNRPDTMVSVKTSVPVPKEAMGDVMTAVHRAIVSAPVRIGDVLIQNIFGADIIATKNIP